MLIENYLGFPAGIPGQSLTGRTFVQWRVLLQGNLRFWAGLSYIYEM
jgi:hypothetical protein